MSPNHRDNWIIIGISGVTCGGKTTLACRLLETLVPVEVYHQDQYFHPDDSPLHTPCPTLDHHNYDVLSALDMDRFHRDVLSTLAGSDCSHESNALRQGGKVEVAGKRFLVIEGFTVLNHEPLNELCHLRYYLTLEYGECAARRALRLYDPPDTPGYFDQCVWPQHLRYRAQIEQDPRVTLLDGRTDDACAIVLSDIYKLGAVKVTAGDK